MDKPILPPAPPSYSTGADAAAIAAVDQPALPPPPAQEERRHAIDFMGPGSSVQNRPIDYDESYDETSARHLDYVERRWEFSEGGSTRFQAISRRSHAVQVAFRLKMLTIFALQLLVVGLVVTAFHFHSEGKRRADDFFTPPTARILLAFLAATVLLVAMYLVRNVCLLNWLLLLLFTFAQCLCCVGLGVVLDTNIGVFNCAFTFACVVIMIALAGVRVKSESSGYSDSGELHGAGLLSSFYAGVIAYVAVALVASALFVVYGRDFVTNEGFYSTLAFQFVLIFWFAYDASAMYKVMSPDEYTHGVIYLYTDLVLMVLMVVVAICFIWCADTNSNSSSNCRCDCDCLQSKKKKQDYVQEQEHHRHQPQVQQPVANTEMYRV